MELSEFKKNYLGEKELLEHSLLVSKLALKMFFELKNYFPFLETFNNASDLKILEYGAVLHDIGVSFEKKLDRGHHKIGRDLIIENRISELSEESNIVAANVVRYHRRALPDRKHKSYGGLTPENQRKTDIFASIVRLCDAFDFNHFGIIEDFKTSYNKSRNILTITLPVNIILNVGLKDNLDKKKEFLELVFNTEVLFN